MIRHVIDSHNDPIPAVLEIPSKECPYDASKDSILRRAKVLLTLKFMQHLCAKVNLDLCIKYRNDPKFSDRQVWATSADPDQTAPRGAV